MGVFEGTRALIVGLGASGAAAARTIAAESGSVRVSEQRSLESLDRSLLEDLEVEVLAGGHSEEQLDGMNLVVVSPGVPQASPVIGWAHERGIEVVSELEIGARVCSVPFVAITGTNGKTTTTEMVAAAMLAEGSDAVACGNIGHPFSTAAREGREMLAVEASSFQLRFASSFHPRVSVLLNLAPDHLDWHGSFEAYAEAKTQIFRLQTGVDDRHVGNADDPLSRERSESAPCPTVWFRLGEPAAGEVGYVGSELAARLDGQDMLGAPTSTHAGFRADAAAAAAASLSFGISARSVREGIASVRPLAHRGQIVATVAGVSFIDDSKATNPHATLASLEGRSDVVLIAGGLAKGLDLSPLTSAADRLTGVVAFGAAAQQVEDLFSGIRPVRRAESVEQAAELALELALESVPPGGSVVLAPGGASQDLFVDYRERGERFAQAARRLASRDEQERAHGGA